MSRRLVVRVITPRSSSTRLYIFNNFEINHHNLVDLKAIIGRYIQENQQDPKAALVYARTLIPCSRKYAKLGELCDFAILSDLQW